MTAKKTAETRKKQNSFIQPIYGQKECPTCRGDGKIVDHFGRRVNRLRLQKKLSNVQLADQARISKRMLTQIENGTSNPNVVVVMAICDVLDCTSDYLLGLTSNPKRKLR